MVHSRYCNTSNLADYAISVGQLDQWIDGIFWQAEREGQGIEPCRCKSIFRIDPVLLILGIAGKTLAVLKRDLFIVLASVPFLIFISIIGFVQLFHWIPVFPAFCIAGGNLIVYLSGRIDNKKAPTTITICYYCCNRNFWIGQHHYTGNYKCQYLILSSLCIYCSTPADFKTK